MEVGSSCFVFFFSRGDLRSMIRSWEGVKERGNHGEGNAIEVASICWATLVGKKAYILAISEKYDRKLQLDSDRRILQSYIRGR